MTKVFVIIMALLYVVLPEVSAAGRFRNNGNGTVTGSKTHLVWQRGEGGKMKWNAAIAYCKNLSLAGHNDWRLPNKEELTSITDIGKDPAINETNFPNAHINAGYWSSTTNGVGTWNAWAVNGSNGFSDTVIKTYSYYVRCVRGGQ